MNNIYHYLKSEISDSSLYNNNDKTEADVGLSFKLCSKIWII